MRVLHFGCGPVLVDGWYNVDRHADASWAMGYHYPVAGRDPITDLSSSLDGSPWLCDITHGLPFPDGWFSAAVSNHALQMLGWPELLAALRELRRVCHTGAIMRTIVPDLNANVYAWQAGDASHFVIPDDEAVSLDGKACLWMAWRGETRSLFTESWLAELLCRSGWRPMPTSWGHSHSPADLDRVDSRQSESLVLEAEAV